MKADLLSNREQAGRKVKPGRYKHDELHGIDLHPLSVFAWAGGAGNPVPNAWQGLLVQVLITSMN